MADERFNQAINQLQLQAAQLGQQSWDAAFRRALALGAQYLDAQQVANEAAQMASQQALSALTLQSQLRGPRNAFQQQQVMMGLNATGLSRGVDAIAGRYSAPSFQAPQAAPEAATLGTMAEDMAAAGGQTQGWTPWDTWQAAATGQGWYQGLPAMYGPNGLTRNQPPTGQYGGPGWNPYGQQAAGVQAAQPAQFAAPQAGQQAQQALPQAPQGGAAMKFGYKPYQTSIGAYSAALPAPNKIVSREWLNLPQDTQDFMLGAYEAQGYSANDVLHNIQRTLPQFRAPRVGRIAA